MLTAYLHSKHIVRHLPKKFSTRVPLLIPFLPSKLFIFPLTLLSQSLKTAIQTPNLHCLGFDHHIHLKMAPHSGSGISKSFFTSLAALLLVAFLAITTGPLAGSPVDFFRKQTPSIVGHVTEDASRAARSPLANSSLVGKRAPPGQGDLSYQGRITKGQWLSCRLPMSIATATASNQGTSLESALRDPTIFQTEGWQELTDPDWPLYGTTLDAAFAVLNINPAHKITLDLENNLAGSLFPNTGPVVHTVVK